MARKLKTYQTSVGFYDLAIAAPPMKTASEAWGEIILSLRGSPRSEVVAATMSKPTSFSVRWDQMDPFTEHAELPPQLADDAPKHRPKKKKLAKHKAGAPRPTDDKAARKAARGVSRRMSRVSIVIRCVSLRRLTTQ